MIGYKTDATVSVILKHPYGRQLMAALLPYTAVQALNMKTKIQGYAAQLVDRLYEVGMDSEDEQVVARIGFGMMDRAGFSAPREAKISHTHSMAAPAASINRLSQALEESMQVSQIPVEADYEIIESPSQPESNNDEERVA